MTKITAPAGCNVYVATLPLDFTDQQMAELFGQYGPITSARVMRSKGTRQSKGYGFVMFKDPRSAELAVLSLHGAVIGTTAIQVRIAHPGASKAGRGVHASCGSQQPHSEHTSGRSESGSSQTDDRADSTTISEATPASFQPVTWAAPAQPTFPVAMPQLQQPFMFPTMPMSMPMSMPQPMLTMPDTMTLLPQVSQPQPMYVVVLPDGRQAFVCGC